MFAHTRASLTVYYGDRKSTQSTNTSASTRAALTPSSMARPYARTSPQRNFHADHVCCICVGTRGSRRRCHCACGRRTQRKRSTSLALHGSDTEAHLQFVNKGQTPLILSTVSAFPTASVAFCAAKSTLVGRMTGSLCGAPRHACDRRTGAPRSHLLFRHAMTAQITVHNCPSVVTVSRKSLILTRCVVICRSTRLQSTRPTRCIRHLRRANGSRKRGRTSRRSGLRTCTRRMMGSTERYPVEILRARGQWE